MKSELDKYGITMPSFGKIGGILASEVSRSCDYHLMFMGFCIFCSYQ